MASSTCKWDPCSFFNKESKVQVMIWINCCLFPCIGTLKICMYNMYVSPHLSFLNTCIFIHCIYCSLAHIASYYCLFDDFFEHRTYFRAIPYWNVPYLLTYTNFHYFPVWWPYKAYIKRNSEVMSCHRKHYGKVKWSNSQLELLILFFCEIEMKNWLYVVWDAENSSTPPPPPPHARTFFPRIFHYTMAFPSRQPVDTLLYIVLLHVWDDYEKNLHFIFVWTTEWKIRLKCQHFLARNCLLSIILMHHFTIHLYIQEVLLLKNLNQAWQFIGEWNSVTVLTCTFSE